MLNIDSFQNHNLNITSLFLKLLFQNGHLKLSSKETINILLKYHINTQVRHFYNSTRFTNIN